MPYRCPSSWLPSLESLDQKGYPSDSHSSVAKVFKLGLILPHAIFLLPMLIAWEVLPISPRALWINCTICSLVGLASGPVRSDHKQARGPVTSSSCSCILYRVFSDPNWGSLPFLESCSLISESNLGVCNTSH